MSELVDKIKGLIEGFDEETLKELEEFAEFVESHRKVDKVLWKPSAGDEYFYVTGSGMVGSNLWEEDVVDVDCYYKQGNAFRTKVQAKVYQGLRSKTGKFNNILISFGGTSEFSEEGWDYTVSWNQRKKQWDVYSLVMSELKGLVYFKHGTDCQDACDYLNKNYPDGVID